MVTCNMHDKGLPFTRKNKQNHSGRKKDSILDCQNHLPLGVVAVVVVAAAAAAVVVVVVVVVVVFLSCSMEEVPS